MSRIDTTTPQPQGLAALTETPFTANLMLGEMASQVTQEMMDFAQRRMKAQAEFVASLPLGDIKGLMEAQFRFLEQASRDYAEEIGHVADVVRKAGEIRDARR
ncbi:hypothetical protein [Falsiroseomonas sp. HW251]|uniref:hypothetical protein n=1 Tax=Falsiroseomonas sp. HW251 TaxID=3390998 RepID=UPI003D31CC6C